MERNTGLCQILPWRVHLAQCFQHCFSTDASKCWCRNYTVKTLYKEPELWVKSQTM